MILSTPEKPSVAESWCMRASSKIKCLIYNNSLSCFCELPPSSKEKNSVVDMRQIYWEIGICCVNISQPFLIWVRSFPVSCLYCGMSLIFNAVLHLFCPKLSSAGHEIGIFKMYPNQSFWAARSIIICLICEGAFLCPMLHRRMPNMRPCDLLLCR